MIGVYIFLEYNNYDIEDSDSVSLRLQGAAVIAKEIQVQ